MSTTESNSRPKFETVLNSIRREAAKIRESQEKLWALHAQLVQTNHPAPAQVLDESQKTIHVALEHLRSVFMEF